MGQRISARWGPAANDVLARAAAEPQIWFEKFEEICALHGVTGHEAVTLAELMHDLGHIIYYGDDDGLRDVVVLNPEWLTQAISCVLDDKATTRAGGVLYHANLKAIWQNDGKEYPARYHPYFLRLMEKFDISYRLEDEHASLVAQLVPYERPADLPWQHGAPAAEGTRVLSMECRLSEPAPGLIPWLTVRHHHASTGLHWRRGIFLRHPIAAYKSEALLELRGDGELAFEVRAPSPDLFFHELRGSIEELIIRRWPGLHYELLIPCPNTMADGSRCIGRFALADLLALREGRPVQHDSLPEMSASTQPVRPADRIHPARSVPGPTGSNRGNSREARNIRGAECRRRAPNHAGRKRGSQRLPTPVHNRPRSSVRREEGADLPEALPANTMGRAPRILAPTAQGQLPAGRP